MTWKGYKIDWCPSCGCAYIKCRFCGHVSCSGLGCEKCGKDLDAFVDFAKNEPYLTKTLVESRDYNDFDVTNGVSKACIDFVLKNYSETLKKIKD